MKSKKFNNNLFKWIVLLPVIGILITSFTLTNIYINSMYKTYEFEVSELEKNYLHDVKEKIKNRINNVSNSIQKLLRKSDLIGRVGGEEFALFLPNTGIDDAVQIAEKIRKTIGKACL